MGYINYNGSLHNEDAVLISSNNRAFRYADGFFETMKFNNGTILLQDLHLERLYTSLETLKFEKKTFPLPHSIVEQVTALAIMNGHTASARIRLTIFAGEGNLQDALPRNPNYLIQSFPYHIPSYTLNEKGLAVDFFKDAVKPCDNFSAIKSNNFLPYVMASLWAKEQNLDDAILLNPYGKVADATIANVFIIKDGFIITPPLADGPVNGVMRKYLLKCMKEDNIPHREASLSPEDVLQASEVFLTNAMVGIQWVERIGASNYTSQMSEYLHQKFLVPLTDVSSDDT